MIANVKWCALGVPLVFTALVVSVDCSNSSLVGCPQKFSDFDVNAACPSDGFACPYVSGAFDQGRSDTTSDCFQDFIEYTCTQKKWTLTAQSATTCTIDATGVLSSNSCSLGIGRCVVPAGTPSCASSCYQGIVTAYSAACVSGQFVVTPSSCSGSPLDAGDQDDAAAIEDAGPGDDASDAADE